MPLFAAQEVPKDHLIESTTLDFQSYKLDLKYAEINFDYDLHFLMQNDTKVDRKLKSFQHIQKCRYAILWGSKVAKELMLQTFYEGEISTLRPTKINLSINFVRPQLTGLK